MLKRNTKNPLVCPNVQVAWESNATFNPCVIKNDQKYIMLYRAMGKAPENHPCPLISSIGYAESRNGVDFTGRRLFIQPSEIWERFGCEDPRVTFIEGNYYIFYTALAEYPFAAPGIRIGLAITKDFQEISEKHLITPFNAKAMALFPERINGQLVAILTVNTDLPPAKIAIATFSNVSDMWSEAYWTLWYQSLDHHIVPLLRSREDHIEVGAPPIKTKEGWLLLYSYIQQYFSNDKIFGTEAALLEEADPQKVKARLTKPLILPTTHYELHGEVPNIIFPSGVQIEEDNLHLYYGAADTTACMASGSVSELLMNLTAQNNANDFPDDDPSNLGFQRYAGNPIIAPKLEIAWEAHSTFNPGAIYLDGHFHIIYRAIGFDMTSVFGYASSKDGFQMEERLSMPIYQPRADFEQKLRPGYSGCEDPRLTVMGETIYMFYTAYDGYTPRVALTSISVQDFLNKNWRWAFPIVITPPGTDDKNACLFPKKINNQFIILHRRGNSICINKVNDMHFGKNQWLTDQTHLIQRKSDYVYNLKFGMSTPPIETPYGWLLFYHRVTRKDYIYKVGAALLDINDPGHILALTDKAILEPRMEFERHGLVPNVVFPCGAVLLDGCVYLYYGCADSVISVATLELKKLLALLGIHS